MDPTPSDHTLNARASEDLPSGWGDQAIGTRGGGSGNSSGRNTSAGRKAVARGENDERLEGERPPHWG